MEHVIRPNIINTDCWYVKRFLSYLNEVFISWALSYIRALFFYSHGRFPESRAEKEETKYGHQCLLEIEV